MPNSEVLRAARSLGQAMQASPPMIELEEAEAAMLNDLQVEQLRAELHVVETRLRLLDYQSKEERLQLLMQKDELLQELDNNPVYQRYQRAHKQVESLTTRVINTVSRALKEDVGAPKFVGVPEAEHLMRVLAQSDEMTELHRMNAAILADDEIQSLLSKAMTLHERIRTRQFNGFDEAKQLRSEIETIEQRLAELPKFQQYRRARHRVDRLANTVLEILSYSLTGRPHEGGCTKNQHAGPAGILACEECGKTSIPLRRPLVSHRS